MTTLDAPRTLAFAQERWDSAVLPALTRYIEIPAKSPAFDPEWAAHGHLDQAVALAEGWVRARPVPGLAVEVVRLPGRTPLVLIEAPGGRAGTVLIYGHLDKQPEMIGWGEGLGPWQAVRRGDRLYGRGAHDDGYAVFAAVTALEALAEAGVPHARAVVFVEACEESGSGDLPAYLDVLANRVRPDLVVCLDSGCGNYDQLWGTTSLRGLVNGVLEVEVLTEGLHSGLAGGLVPSSFRILRQLLARLEDAATGEVLLRDLCVEVPPARMAEARDVAAVLGAKLTSLPLSPGMRLVHEDPVELILNSTWRPALAITGAAGVPSLAEAGNVLRPRTALKLSLRLPPTVDAELAARRVRETLESDPPYGARVRFTLSEAAGSGWEAPPMRLWLAESVDRASRRYFASPPMFMGIGGSIPFMAMLGTRYPNAQFLVTGVGGPESNAHGPNEFLHLPTAVRLTACVAQVLADHGESVRTRLSRFPTS